MTKVETYLRLLNKLRMVQSIYHDRDNDEENTLMDEGDALWYEMTEADCAAVDADQAPNLDAARASIQGSFDFARGHVLSEIPEGWVLVDAHGYPMRTLVRKEWAEAYHGMALHW